MTVLVVDPLEVIDVQHGQREPAARSQRTRDLFAEARLHVSPVEEPGQRVSARELPELFFARAQGCLDASGVRHVAIAPHAPDDLAPEPLRPDRSLDAAPVAQLDEIGPLGCGVGGELARPFGEALGIDGPPRSRARMPSLVASNAARSSESDSASCCSL